MGIREQFIDPPVRRIAIVGAESVGKTTLAAELAAEFGTTWVAEYGRLYCEHRDALALREADFEAIAWGQATWEDEAARSANGLLICDTELHTTCTWSDIVIGYTPEWIRRAARERPYDLFLFLEADLPWVQDGVRVLENRRGDHSRRILVELDAAKRRVVMIGGSRHEQRRESAIAAVRDHVTRQ